MNHINTEGGGCMKAGDTFTATLKVGSLVNSPSAVFDFTVTEVKPSGIVYADGVAQSTRTDGQPFMGVKIRKGVRFKGGVEFQAYNGFRKSPNQSGGAV